MMTASQSIENVHRVGHSLIYKGFLSIVIPITEYILYYCVIHIIKIASLFLSVSEHR